MSKYIRLVITRHNIILHRIAYNKKVQIIKDYKYVISVKKHRSAKIFL